MKPLLLSGTACLIIALVAASIGLACVWSYENYFETDQYRTKTVSHPLVYNVVSVTAMVCSVVCVVSYLGACFFFLRLAWVML